MSGVHHPSCCAASQKQRMVEWREKDNSDGPTRDGWAVPLHSWDIAWVNVKHCPFCGKALPAAPGSA